MEADEDETSAGTLNDALDTVSWTTTDGRYTGSDPVTVADGVITMGDHTYSEEGREAAESEQTEVDAQMQPALEETLAALVSAGQSGDLSGVEGIFAENGITADEFAEYFERNYDVTASEFFEVLQYTPDEAETFLEDNRK